MNVSSAVLPPSPGPRARAAGKAPSVLAELPDLGPFLHGPLETSTTPCDAETFAVSSLPSVVPQVSVTTSVARRINAAMALCLGHVGPGGGGETAAAQLSFSLEVLASSVNARLTKRGLSNKHLKYRKGGNKIWEQNGSRRSCINSRWPWLMRFGDDRKERFQQVICSVGRAKSWHGHWVCPPSAKESEEKWFFIKRSNYSLACLYQRGPTIYSESIRADALKTRCCSHMGACYCHSEFCAGDLEVSLPASLLFFNSNCSAIPFNS